MKCPYCAEEIQPNAQKCKHCGEWLDGRGKKLLELQTKNAQAQREKENGTLLGCFVFPFCLLLYIVWSLFTK